MPSLFRRTSALLAALLGLVASAAYAQPYDGVPDVTRAFAIENARIVQAPGRTIERGTVVVRNGLIEAVGQNVDVPFDAERIAGDSLVVYAGFIDGLSHTGVPEPKEDEDTNQGFGAPPGVEDPGNPPNDVAGIRPDRQASALLQPDEASIEAMREAGFTAAHVVPHGGILPGTGAVILLTNPDDANQMVLRREASLAATFDANRRVYPATPMGVMAQLRTLYREAERRQRGEELYAANAAGMERPPYDPVYQALFPVVAGERPVFFYAEDALEARRALALQRDLGFPLVLAGLSEAFAMMPALEETDVRLLLTLDLPEADADTSGGASDVPADSAGTPAGDPVTPAPADTAAAPTDTSAAPVGDPRVAPDTSDVPADTSLVVADDSLNAQPDRERAVTPEAPGSFFVRDYRTRSYEDVGGEEENLRARQQASRERYYATAATLHEAGLPFGFTAWDVKPADVRKNLRLMIENGLPEEAALAALTTDAADVLGLADRLGSVDRGKIANLVVTTAPYFDEESEVRYVFVDGQRFEVEPESERTSSDTTDVDPAGTWRYTVSTPDGEVGGTLTLTGEPDDLSGTLTSDVLSGEAELRSVSLDGDVLAFTFSADQYGRIDAEVTLDGDAFEGTLDVGDETYSIEGTRTSGPDER